MVVKFMNVRDITSALSVEKFNELVGCQIRRSIGLQERLGGGDHLLFFNPKWEGLCKDGYYRYLSPAAVLGQDIMFKRRLWTQGGMEMREGLKVNAMYECHETIKKVRELRGDYFIKIGREIKDMSGNVAVVEERTLIYTNKPPLAGRKSCAKELEAAIVIPFIFDDMTIFAYSGLTSNLHRIHWDKEYSMKVEGYRDILVQGPLTVHVLLRTAELALGKPVKGIRYKNSQVLYRGSLVDICIGEVHNGTVRAWIRDQHANSTIYVDAELTLD
ncbi:HBR338Wp [Eremothecium sinecaudum]|uniref:HBR338Wp n=1 Tax=Eremothecium sinecaudum TaxID=45286 RepID=A0A109UXC6_9SACH|nr:HBR338Wp [Eremothecium sinecaudum]AMD19239.1 HBR338Wp [Eremothecium sinecaudum]